ncbi:hypothetical protein A5699_16350 [Mycobacterium sp. E802]|uniref:VC0807 family protein n=1 Tax=Mycobacterium sp. E802 TaxID=1834152 RepID=UPI000800473E|nr:VC0807 family protein [Mycobacterium sp. E802]OBG88671.1 hypothetical protein A5699_16350 [Mycobacterium sp. E802]
MTRASTDVRDPAQSRTDCPQQKVGPPHPRSGFADLRRGLVSAALGLAAYYGARYLGASPVEALLTSTAVSALRLGFSAVRTRTFDPIAAFLVTANGITLAVGLLSQSAVITMLGQHIPGVVFQLFVTVGLFRQRPITESLVNWLRPGWVQQYIANREQSDAEARAFHRKHMRLTLAVAIAGFVHLAAAAFVIFTLPVDIAKGTLSALALATDVVIVAIVLGGIGQFHRRRRFCSG